MTDGSLPDLEDLMTKGSLPDPEDLMTEGSSAGAEFDDRRIIT